MRRATLLLLMLAGCGKSGGGPPDGNGNGGGNGGTGGGGDATRLVYKDAAGNVVGVGGATYEDGRGLLWSLDAETARPVAYLAGLSVHYLTADCSGQAYTQPILPGQPFKTVSDTVWRVRPNNQASEEGVALSVRYLAGGPCNGSSVRMRLLALLDSQLPNPAVTEPVWTFIPPLRLAFEP